jgi:pilus assembly protein CpaB
MIKGMTLPKGGSRLPLILGLVLGLVAAALVVVVLTSAEESSVTSSGGEGVPVVVAAQDIPAGTRLTDTMLGVKEIPESDKLVEAFGSTEGVVNQVTKVPLVAGEQVIPTKLATGPGAVITTDGSVPLTFAIDPGQRAVSVGVSSLIGAGGNIRPGDFVDVVLIVELKPQDASPETQGTSDQLAATILQNIEVLAVDQSITNPNADTTDPNAGKDADEGATTLTVQVSPTQGEVLSMAEVCGSNHGGRISVSLRAPGDTSAVPGRAVYADNSPPPTCSGVLGIAALGE